jgi:hypothetical protein
MNEVKRREAMAFHEAAHAVIARTLGLSCAGIAMFPISDSGRGSAMTRSAAYLGGDSIDDQIAGLRLDIQVALAGPAANARYSGDPNKFFDGAGDDFANAQSAAIKIALLKAGYDLPRYHDDINVEIDGAMVEEANAVLVELKTEVEARIEENWPLIERVAMQLMKVDLLAEADIDGLMKQALTAQVPFMITQAHKRRLRELGHDEESITNMTPAAAGKLLGKWPAPD